MVSEHSVSRTGCNISDRARQGVVTCILVAKAQGICDCRNVFHTSPVTQELMHIGPVVASILFEFLLYM